MKLDRSFRLKLRDILVLKVTDITEEEEVALASLAENLTGLCNVPIIVLREGMSIDTLSEQDMVKAGWVRMERRRDA